MATFIPIGNGQVYNIAPMYESDGVVRDPFEIIKNMLGVDMFKMMIELQEIKRSNPEKEKEIIEWLCAQQMAAKEIKRQASEEYIAARDRRAAIHKDLMASMYSEFEEESRVMQVKYEGKIKALIDEQEDLERAWKCEYDKDLKRRIDSVRKTIPSQVRELFGTK